MADEILNRIEIDVSIRYQDIKDLAASHLETGSLEAGRLDCPSMLPEMARGVIAKVNAGEEPLDFLMCEIPVPKSLALAADSEALLKRARFVGSCRTVQCGHWTGVSCRLGHAIAMVQMPSSTRITPCSLHSSCRWIAENGSASCAPCQHVRYVPIAVRTSGSQHERRD